VRNASDHHYLNVGRWCSLLGVLFSIATAYSLFLFSNILAFLQVLVFFFIVPLFGVVILGMLWKRATPAGGFWGFLTAILLSISMWVYVHSFPDGYRPQPRAVIENGAVVTIEKKTVSGVDKIVKVIVQEGVVKTTNVPVPRGAGNIEVTLPATAEALLTAVGEARGESVPVSVLAHEVVLSGTKEHDKFGVKGVPIVLKPGVAVEASDVLKHFVPAAYNPAHVKYIARWENAQEMAVNLYSAIWTLMVCMVVTVVVSLFTTPKPDAELKNLVMGLTPLPDEGPCPWYKSPKLWAAAVLVVVVAINIIFW
jgi:Na+/proline symporter